MARITIYNESDATDEEVLEAVKVVIKKRVPVDETDHRYVMTGSGLVVDTQRLDDGTKLFQVLNWEDRK